MNHAGRSRTKFCVFFSSLGEVMWPDHMPTRQSLSSSFLYPPSPLLAMNVPPPMDHMQRPGDMEGGGVGWAYKVRPLFFINFPVLPQGFTNSPTEFQKCLVMVLQDKIPDTANIFIDDLPIKGSKTQYLDGEENPEVLKKNSGIRQFIWEQAKMFTTLR